MDLKVQKRLAAQVLNCSTKRVVFDNDRLDDIKQAITKRDLRLLKGEGAISMIPARGISQVRTRKTKMQKSKGRQKGPGSRKGKFNTHFDTRRMWRNNVRTQREFLKELVDKKLIDKKSYRDLYLKSKGGYFRSKRHIKIFLEEHELVARTKEKKVQAAAEKDRLRKLAKKIIKQ